MGSSVSGIDQDMWRQLFEISNRWTSISRHTFFAHKVANSSFTLAQRNRVQKNHVINQSLIELAQFDAIGGHKPPGHNSPGF